MTATPLDQRHIAVIGGGINGVMAAWELRRRGAMVTLFEADSLMSKTSQSSTKMLHGGLRYLANGQFALVRQSLRERRWWISQGTPFVHPLALIVPCARGRVMERLRIGLGVKIYDLLARGSGFAQSRWITVNELASRFPDLRCEGLAGGWMYWDAQMNDAELGRWAAVQAALSGVTIRENTRVLGLTADGQITLAGGTERFDAIVNTAGPWAEALLAQNQIPHRHRLTLVRGSHLIIKARLTAGLALPHTDNRLIFVLPYDGNAILGTTEVRQSLDAPVTVSDQERTELIDCYNRWFKTPLTQAHIAGEFSGLRPLVHQPGVSLSRASRESSVEVCGQVITLWGGKWTSARQQGIATADACETALIQGAHAARRGSVSGSGLH